MRAALVAVALFAAAVLADAPRRGLDPAAAKPPVAKVIPKSDTLHGETRIDNYHWLRDKKSAEVLGHLEAENAYTAAVMKPTEKLQATLYDEMLGRIKQTDLSVPYRLGAYVYYTRQVEGKQYPIHCRKKGGPEGAEQILLDLNELAAGKKFFSLGAFAVSDDGNRLAFTTDETGFREYTLQVKDLAANEMLPDRIAKVSGVQWSADGKTLFYATDDAAKRPYRLYRHVLGGKDDELVYEEKDELYRIFPARSRDKKYLFVNSSSSNTTEVRCIPSNEPTAMPRVLLPRETGHRYSVEHRDGLFYLTTDKDAKNYRLVNAPAGDPRPVNWKEVLPHRPDVLIEGVAVFANHVIVSERSDGLPRLHVIDLKAGKDHLVGFPEPIYSVFSDANPEFDTTKFRYRYLSLVTPESVFDYDLDGQKSELLKRTEVRGGYDPTRYVSERRFAVASDGTRIPVSLVYRKDLQRAGGNPTLLYGYGSYGASLPVTFQTERLSLLDRGMVFAMAHIRGGREMGETWHDQGKMLNKKNTFTDFIAVADYLIAEKVTTRDRLAIMGGSAGGLLIGAVLNMRPDLCRAAMLQVPFVDVINTMLDESLPLTVGEFLEWGNPKVKKEYDYMKSYCPYTNMAARDYPSILVRTALNDSQVMYWEPAKYVAKLRALKTDKNPLLFKCNMAAGHGGASGRYNAMKETAFTYAFLLSELGVEK